MENIGDVVVKIGRSANGLMSVGAPRVGRLGFRATLNEG